MKWVLTIVVASIIAIGPAVAETIFHDSAGRVTGKARIDGNSVTHFYDPAGRVTGKARTDANGTTTFYDGAGRVTGRAQRRWRRARQRADVLRDLVNRGRDGRDHNH